jgi:hypothetical protein
MYQDDEVERHRALITSKWFGIRPGMTGFGAHRQRVGSLLVRLGHLPTILP